MANPWLKNKRKNWRDNPTMMDLYRQAMMNKYSPYRKMDLQGQDTVFDYPSALWPQSEATVEEPAFIPRGRTPQPQEEFKEDVKTVITESEDPNVATKKVTTVTGGLMGDVPFDYGQDDDQPAQVQPGTDFFGGDVTDRNTERAIVLAARKRKFLEREAQELAARQKMREQTGGAAPSQQAVEGALERYARMRRSQLAPPSRDDEQIAQVDPRIVALNQPPAPAGIPLGYGQDDPTGAAYEGRFETGSDDAVIRGMIEDSKKHARSKQRAEAGYPAGDEFSHWPVEEKGILDSLTGPTKWGDSAYADTMIRDQDERENLAEKRKKETGSEHPTLQERLGLTEEAFRWKGKNFQKEQEAKEAAIIEKEEIDPSLPGNLQKVGKSSTGWPGPGLDNPPAQKEEDNEQVTADVAKADANPNLWQAWGDYVRKPGERKAAYMKNLSDIFRKAMIMNAVAQLTGGTSQADAYVKFATGKLDAIEKFDQEDRLQSAWKSIMFNENGSFNPPAGYGEALERAAKLGISPKESKAFSALFPKAATSKFWVYDTKAKKNIRITDDQYMKDDGRYTATADAGGRATQAAIVDIPYYFDDAGLDEEQQADVMQILQKPNAIMELWKKYPELMKLYKKKEDETSASGLYGLNALTAAAGRQQEGTQPRTPGIKIESVEDVQ